MKADIKGLTKLAQKLRSVPRKQFDMDRWWDETPCGTRGCIAGWAATFFPNRLKRVKRETYNGNKMHDIVARRTGSKAEFAFADAFHISLNDAATITLENYPATPKQAAKAVMVLVGKLKKQAV